MLADDIEAGGGSAEAVALALGWERDKDPRYMVQAWIYPNGDKFLDVPAFLTDLNALAAECERRKLGWSVDITNEGVSAWVDTHDAWDAEEGRVSAEPGVTLGGIHAARALCAALVRAVEAGNE